MAKLADDISADLTGDAECYADPQKYFDQVIEIDLNTLEPHVNGPYTPDLAWPISKFAEAVADNDYPEKLDVGLIGSCTNSSYEDISRAASIARQAKEKNLKVKAEFTVTPGSELIRYTVERDGLLNDFEDNGGKPLFSGKRLECVAESGYVEKGKKIKVIKVESTQITVRVTETS